MTGSVERDSWTTRRLLQWTSDYLARQGVDHPRRHAEMLLAHVLGVERLRLYMEADRPASAEELARFRGLVQRAGRHEPVDYLVGRTPFFSMELKVSPAVLIPRPSTETLLEHVLQRERARQGDKETGSGGDEETRLAGAAQPPVFSREAQRSAPPEEEIQSSEQSPDRQIAKSPNFLVADIGTGSGAIAIAIAKHLPGARVIATDVCPQALALAQENATEQGVADRIDFRQGNLLEPLAGERVRYLLSNPPYISDAEWAAVAPNVKDYEPVLALRGGEDGLRYLRVLIEQAGSYLEAGGQLAFEMAASQKEAVLAMARRTPGLADAYVLDDHEGLPRVLVASC